LRSVMSAFRGKADIGRLLGCNDRKILDPKSQATLHY
jgi:hypothetical protein